MLEGTFRVQRVRHERAVFLFDKTLLITKRRGDHYVYKSHIPVGAEEGGAGGCWGWEEQEMPGDEGLGVLRSTGGARDSGAGWVLRRGEPVGAGAREPSGC